MAKGIMTLVVVAILAVVGVVIFNAARSVQNDIQTPTGSIDIAKDQAAKSNLVNIRMAIQSYMATSGQLPPAVDEATLGGIVDPWPTNPWTKAPMKSGTGVGDYTYTPGSGTSYTLVVHLSGEGASPAP